MSLLSQIVKIKKKYIFKKSKTRKILFWQAETMLMPLKEEVKKDKKI